MPTTAPTAAAPFRSPSEKGGGADAVLVGDGVCVTGDGHTDGVCEGVGVLLGVSDGVGVSLGVGGADGVCEGGREQTGGAQFCAPLEIATYCGITPSQQVE